MISVTWWQLCAVLLVQLYIVYRITACRQEPDSESKHVMKIELDKESVAKTEREINILIERMNKLSEVAGEYNNLVTGTKIE